MQRHVEQRCRSGFSRTSEEPLRSTESGLMTTSPESPILQPLRHHGVRLQQGGAVLLGRVRLPARRRRRHAIRSASVRSSASHADAAALQDRLDPRARRRRARDLRVPAAAAAGCRFRGTASGLTHISFNVRNLQRWYDYLQRKGVECVSRPERSPRGHLFFFVRDFDGNLIEMMDLGYMSPRAAVARPARRLVSPARDVSQVYQ